MLSFSIKSLRPAFFASVLMAAILSSIASSPAKAQEQQQSQDEAMAPQTMMMMVPVKDYDVFVDLPTAFAFIKLPSGWKFIGKLDAEQLHELPAGTLTSLLMPMPGDGMATRLAAKAPMKTAAKRSKG